MDWLWPQKRLNMNQFPRTTGGFQSHVCTLIREETRNVYSDTIMCIKRHVSLIETCIIRRLSAMFVQKLLEPAIIAFFFLWRKMPSSMKVALSTNIMQLVSSIVIPHCVLQCILAGVPSFSARQGQKISFSIHC